MLNGWLIYQSTDANQNQALIQRFFQKAPKYQIQLHLILWEHLQIGIHSNQNILIYQNNPVHPPHFIIMRTIDHILSSFFQQIGVLLLNPYEISTLANHKFKTYLAMKKLEIPILPTFYYTKEKLQNTQNFPLPFPFVCKSCTGRSGNEVFLIQSQKDLQNRLQNISQPSEWILQPLARVIGRDLRVFVVGKSIIGAILRINETDFRANYSLSQTAKWYVLSEKEKTLVNRIVQAYEFGFVGIDFLFDADGNFIFNEIEDVVGSRTLSIYSNIDAVDLYLKYIDETLKTQKTTLH